MSRTYDSFVVLKAVALTVIFALTLWSLGLPTLGIAQAANVSFFSDTITDSAPSAPADHTIEFIVSSDIPAGPTITLEFEDFGNVDSITADDVAISIDGTPVTMTDWTVGSTGQVITLENTSNPVSIASSTEVEIVIGLSAGGSAENQITNPPTTGSFALNLDVDGIDAGETLIAIVDAVTVTASIDTVFEFSVTGVAAGQTVNGETTTGTVSDTLMAFGTLTEGQATTTAQDLAVTTNAANGFTVTVQSDGNLRSSTGADISNFVMGSDTTTPTEWEPPVAVPGQNDTYGHWGVTSDDGDLSFGASEFVAVLETPTVVFSNNGPADGDTQDVGKVRVGYKIEVTALQEAADDYETVLTYIATPVF